MALAQELVVATQVEVQRYGYQAVSLTNFTSDTLEPQIAAGSRLEIGGALFVAAGNESITGWGGISVSSDVYIKLTVSGASATASFTTTAPTWSTSKQGFYDGSDRYIGGLYKDGSGNYARKWLYEEKQIASVKRYGSSAVELTGAVYGSGYGAALIGEAGLKAGSADTAWLRKVVEIGDWNMDTTVSVTVTSSISGVKIRRVSVVIRSDGAASYLAPSWDDSGTLQLWIKDANMSVLGGVIICRLTGGDFDNSSFDSTSYNRGWVTFEYEP
jgi:hypothetical protein